MTSSRRRRAIFAALTVALALLASTAAGAFYLFGYKNYAISSLRQSLHFDKVRAYVLDPKFRQLVSALQAEHATDANTFATVWDTSVGVRLSRRMYRDVEMYGVPRYMYRPYLKKVAFYARFRGVSLAVETVDTAEIRAALTGVDTPLRVTGSYDQYGFRVADPDLQQDCQSRVLFLGDSFTDGLWVNDSETFVNHYARLVREQSHLRLCPVNAAVNGYGTLEESYVLEHYFDAAGRPPLIIVVHHPNDIEPNDRAVLQGTTADAERNWSGSLTYLARMARFARENGATLMIAAIPTVDQVINRWSEAHYQDILRSFCDREGIRFIDLLPRMAVLDPHVTYLALDPHSSPRGHVEVAQVLYDETKLALARSQHVTP